MIHYELRCGRTHEFDGWFPDSAGFEDQLGRGLIECPACGGRDISRALMAPLVARPRTASAPVPGPALPATKAAALPASASAAELHALLRRIRMEVERNCEHVGQDFAAEARRIHQGEATPRGIYGEASEAEAEALRDDGIDLAQIPWVPLTDT